MVYVTYLYLILVFSLLNLADKSVSVLIHHRVQLVGVRRDARDDVVGVVADVLAVAVEELSVLLQAVVLVPQPLQHWLGAAAEALHGVAQLEARVLVVLGRHLALAADELVALAAHVLELLVAVRVTLDGLELANVVVVLAALQPLEAGDLVVTCQLGATVRVGACVAQVVVAFQAPAR